MLETQDHIAEARCEPHLDASKSEDGMVTKICAALDEIRPFLQRDGGDCQFVGLEGNVVRVKMSGACIGCQLASVTIHGIQSKLNLKLGTQFRVAPVLGFGGL